MGSFVCSGYVNVCSATGLFAPGYLPEELPTGPGDPYLCHVNTWTSFTGVNPSSGGVFDPLVLSKQAGYGSGKAFKKAVRKYPELHQVVHVSGTGRKRVYAAYPGSLDGIAEKVREQAEANQLAPLKPYCPYIKK